MAARNRTFLSILKGALDEKTVIIERGVPRRVSKIELIVRQLVNQAASGDTQSINRLIALINSTRFAKAEVEQSHKLTKEDTLLVLRAAFGLDTLPPELEAQKLRG